MAEDEAAATPVMFMGTYSPRMDSKGRFILPAKLAPGLTDGVVLTRGQERCLYLYAKDDFTRLYERLRQQPPAGKSERDSMRLFLAGAHDQDLDPQRRVLIPTPLRTYANLTADLTLIGVGDRVEIWDAPSWETYLQQQEQAFATSDWDANSR